MADFIDKLTIFLKSVFEYIKKQLTRLFDGEMELPFETTGTTEPSDEDTTE